MANTTIPTELIAADAITGAKIADDAIDSEHYTDGSIDAAHIASNAVTSAKLDTNIAVSGTLGVTGVATFATHVVLGDSDELRFGAGNDARIFSDGTSGYIRGVLALQNSAGDKDILTAADGGATSLFYNNSAKLATSNTGVDVTGILSCNNNMVVQGGGAASQITMKDSGGTIDGYVYGESGAVGFLDDDGAWAIQHTTDTRTTFKINDSEKMRIASDGTVGIGTTSIDGTLHIDGGTSSILVLEKDASGAGTITFHNAGSQNAYISNAADEHMYYYGASGVMQIFYAGGAETLAMQAGQIDVKNADLKLEDSRSLYLGAGNDLRIYHDASDSYIKDQGTGNLLIQGSDIYFGDASGNHRMAMRGAGGLSVGATTDVGDGNIFANEGVYVGSYNGDYQFRSDSAGAGTHTMYIGNASITVSSDERIKENITNTSINATDKLKQVRVVDFTWNDPTDTSFNNKNARGEWTGILAQELVSIFPHVINAPRKEDTLEIDNDSERIWHVDYEHLVPVLIKCIQELEARIAELEK